MRLFSDFFVDVVLTFSALLPGAPEPPGDLVHHSSYSQLHPAHLGIRSLPAETSRAPHFLHDSVLARRSSHASMRKRCIAKSIPKGSGGSGNGTLGNGSDGNGTIPIIPPVGGLIQVNDTKCGLNGAVHQITVAAGPNGNIDWIDCGISKSSPTSGGWTPPNVRIEDLVYISLPTALNSSNSPFSACANYISAFTKVSNEKNIPAIMLASFAMQESGCNPNATGQGGEVGMFQLSPDKCVGVSNCFDAQTNMELAATYIQAQLKLVGGNVFMMIGNYNGWTKGMTYAAATAAANTACCHCQNNLDYIHQVVNGWYQNIDTTWYGADGKKLSQPTSLGTFLNLAVCSANPGNSAIGRRSLVRGQEGGWTF